MDLRLGEQKMMNYKREVDGKESEIGELMRRREGHEQELLTLQMDVQYLSGQKLREAELAEDRYQLLKKRFEEKELDTSEMHGRLERAETEISELKKRLESRDRDIADMAKQISMHDKVNIFFLRDNTTLVHAGAY